MVIALALIVLLLGAGLVAASVRPKPAGSDLMAYLAELGEVGDQVEPEAKAEDQPADQGTALSGGLSRLSQRLGHLYPRSHLDKVQAKLFGAGLISSLRPEEFVTIQVAAALSGLVLAALVLGFGIGHGILKVLMVGFLLVASVLGPNTWLSGRADRRKKAIEAALPDTLDLLTISVEAGLGLEAALASVSDEGDGPLAAEIRRTLQEMNLGLSRQQALENLRHRAVSPDLDRLILVLTQADGLGIPIGRVLRTQSDEMRSKRRARAREKAAKLPVKILFPLMVFILPPLLIVVLGPAVMGIAKMFSHGGI